MENLIMKVLRCIIKFLIIMVLGLIYMWFALSFKWSFDDMSTLEKVVGIVYSIMVIPIYLGIKYLLGLK